MAAGIAQDGVPEILQAMARLLEGAGDLVEARFIDGLAQEIRECKDRSERQGAIREILNMYTQGMGGFQDIVLQDANGVRPEQQDFNRLRSQLFRLASGELRSHER